MNKPSQINLELATKAATNTQLERRVKIACEAFNVHLDGKRLNAAHTKTMQGHIERHQFTRLLGAIEMAALQYIVSDSRGNQIQASMINAFNQIGEVAEHLRKTDMAQIYHAKKILSDQFKRADKKAMLALMMRAYMAGATARDMQQAAKNCATYKVFEQKVSKIMGLV